MKVIKQNFNFNPGTKKDIVTSVVFRKDVLICFHCNCLIFQELNERERAEHATRKYDQLQSLLKELEERNAELEQKFAEVCSYIVVI